MNWQPATGLPIPPRKLSKQPGPSQTRFPSGKFNDDSAALKHVHAWPFRRIRVNSPLHRHTRTLVSRSWTIIEIATRSRIIMMSSLAPPGGFWFLPIGSELPVALSDSTITRSDRQSADWRAIAFAGIRRDLVNLANRCDRLGVILTEVSRQNLSTCSPQTLSNHW
jgi:hypothetical protein